MEPRRSPSRLDALTAGRPVPRLAKAGGATILLGLLADVAQHAVVTAEHDLPGAGFALGEHAVHLVVLVGMVLVLVGIVADGTRPRGRSHRQEGSPRDAVR